MDIFELPFWIPVAPPVKIFQVIKVQFVVKLAGHIIHKARVIIRALVLDRKLDFFQHRKGAQATLPLVRFMDAIVAGHALSPHVKITCSNQSIATEYIKLNPITGH